MEQVFICDAIRTPIGRYAGALSSIRADDLAALPIEYLKQQHHLFNQSHLMCRLQVNGHMIQA